MSTPAGWYPTNDGRQRYWDGELWTEHYAPGASALPVPHVPTHPPPPQYSPQAYPVPYQVAPKNPALAALASFFLPGLGSMIIGRAGIGIGIMVGYFISVVFAFILIGIPFVFGFWVWGMVDAYSGARSWNAAHGIIS